jgi:hypothetical protein
MENIIRSIDPGSPLEHRAAVGDRLVSINGKQSGMSWIINFTPTTGIFILSFSGRTAPNTASISARTKAATWVWTLKAT